MQIFHFVNSSILSESLLSVTKLTVKGMTGIFVVMLVLFLLIALLNKVFKQEDNNF